jgi:23S rRNA (cytosine1962-C5)-methyltransferase
MRALEGLPREVRQVRGVTPEVVEVHEEGLRFPVDLRGGQKTGAFLDQRENRAAAARLARGRVLDAFCYQGGFALHASRAADSVVGVDSSGPALEWARTSAGLNGLENVTFRQANVFGELKRLVRRGERFETVLLDPPALAKRRADLPAAERAYKEVNLRAMRLLSAGGILMTSSCSYNLSEVRFLDVLAAAARDARRTVRVLERRTQSLDHPVLLGFPESHYLKCLVLSVS